MPIETDNTALSAERVSDETIRKMNFLTGTLSGNLKNTKVIMSIRGHRYELVFDRDGKLKVSKPAK